MFVCVIVLYMGLLSKLGKCGDSALIAVFNGFDKLLHPKATALIKKLNDAKNLHAPELPIEFRTNHRLQGGVLCWLHRINGPKPRPDLPETIHLGRAKGDPKNTFRLTAPVTYRAYDPDYNPQWPPEVNTATPWQGVDGKAIRQITVNGYQELFAALEQVAEAVKLGYRLTPSVGKVSPPNSFRSFDVEF